MTANNGIQSLLSMEELKSVFKHFSIVAGVNISLVDESGTPLLIEGNEESQSVCKKVRACNAYKKNCMDSMKYGAKKALELGEPYIYSCQCGLILCSSPIVIEEKLVASVAIGPVMLWENDEVAEDELYKNISKVVSSDEIAVLTKSIKQLECVNMTSSAYMLSVMVEYMCKRESRYLMQRKQISIQQAEISNMLLEKKLNAANLHIYEKMTKLNKYPIDKEKELIALVQMGDRVNSRRMLNDLLGEVFSFSAGNMDIIKSRLYELLAILSRAAVDAGAPLEALSQNIDHFSKIIGQDVDFETLCHITSEAMDNYLETVYLYRTSKKTSEHLTKAIRYINENFSSDIGLEQLSRQIFVSTYYLSHLFRDEMDMTFSDYLLKVRMESAKKLLKERVISIKEISEQVGFNDANYFAKAFKKFFGVSPKDYKSFF